MKKGTEKEDKKRIKEEKTEGDERTNGQTRLASLRAKIASGLLYPPPPLPPILPIPRKKIKNETRKYKSSSPCVVPSSSISFSPAAGSY